MKVKTKIAALLVAGLFSTAIIFTITSQAAPTVQAANHTLTKTIMHNSVAYTEAGKHTKNKYRAFTTVKVEDEPVIIKKQPYYKLKGKNRYLKASNIDGVKRKVKHNSYVYATSTRKASLNLIRKGRTIITYGSALRFKNGKRYYRIGGPIKQYLKAGNVGAVIGSPTEETTVTAIAQLGTAIYGTKKVKIAKAGTKFKVDRLETGSPAAYIMNQRGQFVPEPKIYRIKGTDHWLWFSNVKAKKKLPVHDYNEENFSYVSLYKDIDVYNADGSMQDHDGQKISKKVNYLRVEKLLYLWVPADQKAELFYNLTIHQIYSNKSEKMELGDAYVRASDVKYGYGIKLKPSNTKAEVEAQAQAQAKSAANN